MRQTQWGLLPALASVSGVDLASATFPHFHHETTLLGKRIQYWNLYQFITHTFLYSTFLSVLLFPFHSLFFSQRHCLIAIFLWLYLSLYVCITLSPSLCLTLLLSLSIVFVSLAFLLQFFSDFTLVILSLSCFLSKICFFNLKFW